MNWLVNLAILGASLAIFCGFGAILPYFVVCYFVLGLIRERKNGQRGDVLPRYTTERSKAEIELESKEIIKRELSRDRSYEFIKSKGWTGFLNYYLRFTRNDETLTTSAKSDFVKTLTKNDLLRDLEFFFIFVVFFRF